MSPRGAVGGGTAGVRHAYDVLAEAYAAALPDTRAEATLDLAMIDAFVEAVRAAAASSPGLPPRVLDAGCGTGRMSRHLAAAGVAVTAVDLSPGMATMARRDQADLDLAVGSLLDLPFGGESFTGVLLWYSTIHVEPTLLPQVFGEVSRVVRPGGQVLVGFQAGVGRREVRTQAYGHLGPAFELERHLYGADEVAAQMAQAGLTERCRLLRRAGDGERDDQAFLLASR